MRAILPSAPIASAGAAAAACAALPAATAARATPAATAAARSVLAAACAAAGAVACATAAAPRPAPAPPRHEPVVVPEVGSDEAFAAHADRFALLPIDHPRRGALRAALTAWQAARLAADLDHRRPEQAFARLGAILSLYHPAELRAPPPVPALVEAARRVRDAFAPRGAEREVLAALATIQAFGAGETAERAHAETGELLVWIEDVRAQHAIGADRFLHAVELLEDAVSLVPAPALVGELRRRLLALHARVARDRPRGAGAVDLFAVRHVLARTGWHLVRAHLSAVRIEDAVADSARIAGQVGDDPELRAALARAASARAAAGDLAALARRLCPEGGCDGPDASIALRLCLDAALRFPAEAAGWACAGDLAARDGRFVLASRALERALEIEPRDRARRVVLAQVYEGRMRALVGDDAPDLPQAAEVAGRAERHHQATRRLWPDAAYLDAWLAEVRYLLGLGHLYAGALDAAERHLGRAIELDPLPAAMEKIGVVRAHRGDHAAAVDWFLRARPLSRPHEQVRLLRLQARALDALGRAPEAADRRREALALAEGIAGPPGGAPPRPLSGTVTEEDEDLRRGIFAEVEWERAELLDALGEREAAVRALERAVDLSPEDVGVRAVAFLSTRGLLDDAVGVYHRVLGREAGDYIKVYASLWIHDLSRRRGRADPLALRTLASADGEEWWNDLARWASGRMSYAELEARARTGAHRAELWFYEAQNRLAAGDLGAARDLWRRVLRTDMVEFFEYGMAQYYLSTTTE